MGDIVSPTFVIEGEYAVGARFAKLRKQVGRAPVQFLQVPTATQFDVLS